MSIHDDYNSFPDVHPNIVLKTDVLRQGMKISESAQKEFNQRDDILWRDSISFPMIRIAPRYIRIRFPWVSICPMGAVSR